MPPVPEARRRALMPSATLTPHYDSGTTQAYALVSTSATETVWRVAGRSLSQPIMIKIGRKINPSGTANNHVILQVLRTDNNATTGKPATFSATLDLSIPRDNTILTPSVMVQYLDTLSSLINENAALAATAANATALIDGRDL